MTARLLVIGIGNASRGDDGLGPALLAALSTPCGVDVLTDYQLQVEHALDLEGRDAVLFVDAARPGSVPGGVALTRVAPAAALPVLSHALSPAGVLHVVMRLGQPLPEAWQLAIEGEVFALGEGLCAAAQSRLARALPLAQAWIESRLSARAAASA